MHSLTKFLGIAFLFASGCSTTFHKEILFSNSKEFDVLDKKLKEKAIVTLPISDKQDAFISQNPKLCVAKGNQKIGLFVEWSDAARTKSKKQTELEAWLKTLGYDSSNSQILNYGENADLEPARQACGKLTAFYWPEI